jgi:hypothetical protein
MSIMLVSHLDWDIYVSTARTLSLIQRPTALVEALNSREQNEYGCGDNGGREVG